MGRNGDGRQTLQWDHETTIRSGEVRCDITSAAFGGGRRGYSVVIARQMDDRISKFLRPQDIEDLENILPQLKDYIDGAKARDRG